MRNGTCFILREKNGKEAAELQQYSCDWENMEIRVLKTDYESMSSANEWKGVPRNECVT